MGAFCQEIIKTQLSCRGPNREPLNTLLRPYKSRLVPQGSISWTDARRPVLRQLTRSAEGRGRGGVQQQQGSTSVLYTLPRIASL